MPEQTSLQLLREMFVIFVVAKVAGEIFERLKLPAVLGEIVAGVMLGPYALRLVVLNDTIYSLAQLGAVFLLFMVGLQTQPQELIAVGHKSLQVALAGMAVPFVAGFGYLFLRHEPAHQATFVAAAMVSTSVGVTARVLRDLKVMHTHAARVITGAAVFDDILGMVLLALVVGLASSGGVHWLELSVLALEALGFTLLMIYIGPRFIERVSPRLERMSTRHPQLVLALAICLGLSAAAERIGLTAIIGAFFAGLVFSEYAHEWRLRPRINAINEFLTPYFFFAMGAQLNIHAFTREVWMTATVISVLAIAAKIIGCGLPVLHEGRRAALQVGVGMTPRGEVGLIIALIGLQMNMISQAAYVVVVFMTAATTLIAPPLMRLLFRQPTDMALHAAAPQAASSPAL